MKGIIYKISNEDESIVYIGSTTKTLKERWRGHISSFNRWVEQNDRCHSMIYHHFKDHGIDKFKIELISEHNIDEKTQLLEFEQKMIDKTRCVNKCKSFTGIKSNTKTEYDSKYRELYRDKRNEQKKQHYNANKNKIQERISQRIQCECGSEVRRGGLSRHAKTEKHQAYLQSQ